MLGKEDLLIRNICCLKQGLSDKHDSANILSAGLDWDYILNQARENNVLPLLYKALLNIKDIEKLVPLGVWSALRNSYYLTVKRNIIIFNTLESIASLLKNEGIDIIIFKGPALIELAYSDIGIRPMADIDILIKKNDLTRIGGVLKNNGYSACFDFENIPRLNFSAYRDTFVYQNAEALQIELHWHIINLLPYHSSNGHIQKIDMGKIWNDAVEIKLGNTVLRTLSISHQIICLCIHGFKHSYKPLMLLCDINEFSRVKKENIDWDILAAEAFKFGLSKYVYYGLYLTSQIFKTEIPQYAINRLKPKRISLFEKKYIDSILEGRPVFRDEYAIFLVYLAMHDTLTDRVQFLRNVLFPSREYLSFLGQEYLSRIPIREYVRRLNIGFNSITKFLFNKN